jgi:Mg-chelatase subunit ChlD
MAQANRTSTQAERPATPGRVGWQGRERTGEVARHRWQRDWTTQSADRLSAQRQWRRVRIGLLLSFAGLLFALLVYYLLFAPAQTPVLAVAATNYGWPWAPNAWAREDLDGLGDLDRQTIRLSDGSAAWDSPQRGLDHLQRQLQNVKRHPPRTGVVVILISMHGVVDGAGQPCLAPPSAAPLLEETWLPVSALLERIKTLQLPDELHKLLIFDCNRQQTNWHAGQLWNTFADGLDAAVAEAKIPNLVVLNSTSPGEVGASAAELQGSLFGHYLRLGLAGAADGAQEGNGNGRVSLVELQSYLQDKMNRWALHHRGHSQRPLLVPAGAPDFDIVWSQRKSTWREMVARSEQIERAAPSVSSTALRDFWTSHDRFAQYEPYRYDPLAWRDFEHRLLELELLANSGRGYADAAGAQLDELTRLRDGIQRRIDAAAQQRSLPVQAAIFSGASFAPAAQFKLHSLPLAGFFGELDTSAVARANGQIEEFEESPTAAQLDQTVRLLAEAGLPDALSEVRFLQFLQRYSAPQLWNDAAVLAGAVEVHCRGERLAAPLTADGSPADVRAHYWMHAQLDAADALRRQAVDRFFVGQEASDGEVEPGQLWAAANAAYDEAEKNDRVVAAAFHLRDRAWAETPYLAQWATRPQSQAPAQQAADNLIRQTLLPLIESTRELAQEFWRDEPGQQDVSELPSDDSLKATRQHYTALRAAFDEQAKTLSTTLRIDGAALRDIDALLATPLLTWPRREALERKRLEIAGELAKSFTVVAAQKAKPDASPSDETDAAGASAARGELERMEQVWVQHPLVAILRGTPEMTAPTAEAATSRAQPAAASGAASGSAAAAMGTLRHHSARLGLTVRQQLSALASQDLVYGRTPPPEVPGKKRLNTTDAALTLRDCCRGEALVRAAAALQFEPPPEDPVARLRQFDVQQLLLWQSRRALDDFWGSAGSRAEPLFATAAADYLAAARAIGLPNPQVQAQHDRLAELLARRVQAASEAFSLSAADILLIDQATGVHTQLQLRATSPEAVAALPAGEAVTFLADTSGRIPGATRPLELATVEAEPDAAPLSWDYALASAALADRGPQLEAIAMFRGNEFSAPLLLRGTAGAKVDFQPYVYGPPRVTLTGYGRKRASVIFILDCSDSMKGLVDVEAPSGTQAATATRLDVARSALQNLLAQLAEDGDARVGVRFFGHRVGWNTKEAGVLLRQNHYIHEIDPQLKPYADVETILPLGRFDSVAAGKVYDALASVQPWGESPLYLAITESLRDFSAADDDAERSIVVITDGANNQYNPPAAYDRTKDNVLTAWREAQVPINIVGFGIPNAEAEQARRDFEEITSRTGGRYFPATNSTAVIQSLQSLLKASTYTLRDPAGNKIDEAPLDTTVAVTPVPQVPTDYSISFERLRDTLELAGGEAAELVVSRDGNRIESLPYIAGVVAQEKLTRANTRDPSGLSAYAHRPIRMTEGVRFPISLQRDDRRFTPRPAEMWIEIQPRLASSLQSGKYIFYDVNYAPDRPVPVLEWLAEQWPSDARQAEIRIWCKPSVTPATAEVPLATVANLPPPAGDGFQLDDVPGMSYQARTLRGVDGPGSYRIAIVERHATESAGVGSLKVELTNQPERIVRQFDLENRLVLHTFYYKALSDDDASRLKIRFTTRAAAHAKAWQLDEPLLIDIADRGDLLPLTPPQPVNR